MAQTLTNLLFHVVFSTKDRLPLIDAELKPDLLAYIGGIVRELGGKLLAANGTADHVHLLLRLPPRLALADAVRVVKTNSSRWVHQSRALRRRFQWQAGYGAFSVSQSNVPEVVRYIRNQEQHHRRVSFQEELLAFLKRHGIEYDEQYIRE